MKNSYLMAVFLFALLSMSGCGNITKQGTVVIADEDNTVETEVITDELVDSDDLHRESSDDNNGSGDSHKVYVYVCGHVLNPGVYELEDNDRIYKALMLAGGVSNDARAEVIAQAKPVTDGMTIYVPAIDEDWDLLSDTSVYVSDNGEQDDNNPADSNDSNDINKMTKEDWMRLPGIGEAKADAIIDYRSDHGDFENVEDIMNVPGIKKGVFDKIKDLIKM